MQVLHLSFHLLYLFSTFSFLSWSKVKNEVGLLQKYWCKISLHRYFVVFVNMSVYLRRR
jgi:hypothetical protein